jgi:hypothetical protein
MLAKKLECRKRSKIAPAKLHVPKEFGVVHKMGKNNYFRISGTARFQLTFPARCWESINQVPSGEKPMKTEINELCPSCRNLPWGNGATLEEMLKVIYNSDKFKNEAYSAIDEVNVMIFSTLNKYKSYCNCSQLVLNRIPRSMIRI